MTDLEVIQNELKCVQRDYCCRLENECAKCDLVLPKEVVVRAYTNVIDILQKTRRKRKMENLKVKIKLIEGGKMPEFKTDGAVCADCNARCEKPIEIKPNERKLVPLGFAVELPKGYEMVVRPRSGMSRRGVDVVIGTVDWDYRGEVSAILVNNLDVGIAVEDGTRICQVAIREVPEIEFEAVNELSETERGGNGFGSTGK